MLNQLQRVWKNEENEAILYQVLILGLSQGFITSTLSLMYRWVSVAGWGHRCVQSDRDFCSWLGVRCGGDEAPFTVQKTVAEHHHCKTELTAPEKDVPRQWTSSVVCNSCIPVAWDKGLLISSHFSFQVYHLLQDFSLSQSEFLWSIVSLPQF